MIKLPKLPYKNSALAPYISEETVNYHYGKHHKNYVNKLNEIIAGGDFEKMSLEEIILKSRGAIFNNAAQIWNHTFYWFCMTPNGKELTADHKIYKEIVDSFGSVKKFEKEFLNSGMKQFGSGWTWLIKNSVGKLSIVNTSNAECLVTSPEARPVLVCDVWEHAYYIDTRNDRQNYIKNFMKIINWDFCEEIFTRESYSSFINHQ